MTYVIQNAQDRALRTTGAQPGALVRHWCRSSASEDSDPPLRASLNLCLFFYIRAREATPAPSTLPITVCHVYGRVVLCLLVLYQVSVTFAKFQAHCRDTYHCLS